MVQRRGGARLLPEATNAVRVIGQGGLYEFERNLALQPRVLRQVHLTLAALAQRGNNFVVPKPLAG